MKTQTANLITEVLSKIGIDIYPEDIIDFETTKELTEFLENNNYFEKEITYYGNAIQFLSEYDPGLLKSIQLAADLGYSIHDIDSELLASLLATEQLKELYYNNTIYEIQEILRKYEEDEDFEDEDFEDENENN